MPTYRLTIEYVGTRYSGWQTQKNTEKTVQGKLLSVANEAFGEADVGGAGRTDAGVHAIAQMAHLRIRSAVPLAQIPIRLNDLLPHDIHVLRAERAPEKFHARHDALERIYLYQIATRRTAFAKPFVWWIRDRLDVEAMRRAGGAIVGMHDFALLADKRAGDESTRVAVERFELGISGDLILVRIGASHFLWKMVRKTIAALAEVGRGNMSEGTFRGLVEGRGNRFEPSAPASGLFLEAVRYRGESFDRSLEPVIRVR